MPLQPFNPPALLLANFGTGAGAMKWFILCAFVVWAIYSAVASYHWFRYSHASALAIPAVILHLFVSFILFSFAGSVLLLAALS